MTTSAPDAGDIVWIDFDPQAGHEQAGHRPALVLSPRRYNALRGMMVCCPMTSRIKGYPFEVVVSQQPPSFSASIGGRDEPRRRVLFPRRSFPRFKPRLKLF